LQEAENYPQNPIFDQYTGRNTENVIFVFIEGYASDFSQSGYTICDNDITISCYEAVRSVVRPPQYSPDLYKWWLEQPPRALTLEVTAHVSDAGHRTPSVYHVWSSQSFPFRRYGWFSVMARWPSHLTFRSLNGVIGDPCHGLPSCQFSALPFRSPLRVRHGSGTDRQTDRRTDDGHRRLMLTPYGEGHNNNIVTVTML